MIKQTEKVTFFALKKLCDDKQESISVLITSHIVSSVYSFMIFFFSTPVIAPDGAIWQRVRLSFTPVTKVKKNGKTLVILLYR